MKLKSLNEKRGKIYTGKDLQLTQRRQMKSQKISQKDKKGIARLHEYNSRQIRTSEAEGASTLASVDALSELRPNIKLKCKKDVTPRELMDELDKERKREIEERRRREEMDGETE